MNYKWIITIKKPIELVGKNQLEKQSIVLEEITDNKFKWSIVVDFIKDKVELLNWFHEWDEVEVWLNIRASEYNDRHFNNVNWRKIEKLWNSKKDDDFTDDLPF
jgi:hypothetical protein